MYKKIRQYQCGYTNVLSDAFYPNYTTLTKRRGMDYSILLKIKQSSFLSNAKINRFLILENSDV